MHMRSMTNDPNGPIFTRQTNWHGVFTVAPADDLWIIPWLRYGAELEITKRPGAGAIPSCRLAPSTQTRPLVRRSEPFERI